VNGSEWLEERALLRGHLQNMIDLADYSLDVLSGSSAQVAQKEIDAAKEFLEGPVGLREFLVGISQGSMIPLTVIDTLLHEGGPLLNEKHLRSQWKSMLDGAVKA
jgi:hypothetical protein